MQYPTPHRALTDTEIGIINALQTDLAKSIETHLAIVRDHILRQRRDLAETLNVTEYDAEAARLRVADPERWLAVARSDFQLALMELSRAVAQPVTF